MRDCAWDPSLETGDPLVDEQHRTIHRIVAFVETADDRPDQLMTALELLMEHVACHFATEEDLMSRTGYPNAEASAHMDEHRALTAAARDIVLQFRAGGITSTRPVAEFLRQWLTDHVQVRDRSFINFVRANGELARLPDPWATTPPAEIQAWTQSER